MQAESNRYEVVRSGNRFPVLVTDTYKTKSAAVRRAESLFNSYPEYEWKVFDAKTGLCVVRFSN